MAGSGRVIRAYRLAGVLATCLLVGLAIWLAPLEPGVVALQFAVTPTAFGKIVHAWSPQDLERYRAHLPVDTLLALAYGGFGLGWVRASPWFASMGAGARRVAAGLLPLAALADVAENGWHFWLTEAPRFGIPAAYAIAAACAALKWGLLLGFAFLVAARLWRER